MLRNSVVARSVATTAKVRRLKEKENKMTEIGDSGIYYFDDKVIGQGLTAIVYKGYFRTPMKKAAVKKVFSEHADISNFELGIWLQIGTDAIAKENVNIVQLFCWKSLPEAGKATYHFAMEMASSDLESTLQHFAKTPDTNWRQKCLGYLNDAARGLQWLHSKAVIHRDIKPENILIFCQENEKIAKLSDFGISKKISENSKSGTESYGKGTLSWIAPEAIKAKFSGNKYYGTNALDIFSFGMTGHYVLTMGKTHPFENNINKCPEILIEMNILNKIEPSKIGNEEYAADHLFQWMMSYVPNGRPNIKQVLNHPLFWKSRKQLKFIVDLAKSLDNPNNSEIENLKKKIDAEYEKLHPNFDWKLKLDSEVKILIFERKFGYVNRKKKNVSYECKSVCSLIKLIRDKDVHNVDLMDELITDKYFGRMEENGEHFYCEEKYWQYFAAKFPDLLLFLFVFLVKDCDAKTVNSRYGKKYGLEIYFDKIPDVVQY